MPASKACSPVSAVLIAPVRPAHVLPFLVNSTAPMARVARRPAVAASTRCHHGRLRNADDFAA